MTYSLYRDLIALTEEYENEVGINNVELTNFSRWLSNKVDSTGEEKSLDIGWEGKAKGRTADSVINTSLVHLYKYAKVYGKAAISNSPFSTIEDVIFLINLLHFGTMTKMMLIELNIHEKSTGIQIINRLLAGGFITEVTDKKDRRSKQISISKKGEQALDDQMHKIREASRIVTGNLSEKEKLQLIMLLHKLEEFHKQKLKEV